MINEVILACAGFSFAYGRRKVLDGINFTINRGEMLFILGANGSGKSTLLKNMMRLAHGQKSGEIRVRGRLVEEYDQKALAMQLAYMPQAGNMLPPFTVRQFLDLSRYPFRRYGKVNLEDGESILRALELTNTAHLSEQRMNELSGGQRQRVFLAAALAQSADTLLLDEPGAFLDPGQAFAMNELLKKLHVENGFTIVTVTHDLSQPLDIGGKALVLCAGKQHYFGPVGNLAGHGVLERAFEHEFSYVTHPKTGKILVIP